MKFGNVPHSYEKDSQTGKFYILLSGRRTTLSTSQETEAAAKAVVASLMEEDRQCDEDDLRDSRRLHY